MEVCTEDNLSEPIFQLFIEIQHNNKVHHFPVIEKSATSNIN